MKNVIRYVNIILRRNRKQICLMPRFNSLYTLLTCSDPSVLNTYELVAHLFFAALDTDTKFNKGRERPNAMLRRRL